MAELYTIEKQTLTDIADALRARHGETKIVETDEPIYTMTAPIGINNNVSGDPISFDYLSGSDGNDCCVITFPHTERIHIRIKYNLNGRSENPADQYLKIATGDWYNTCGGTHAIFTDKMPENSIVITGIGEQEFWFDANAVTIFYYADNWYLPAGQYGYCAECTLYGKLEIPNVYTSAEMADAINNLQEPIPDEVFVITDACSYRFSYNGWNWFIDKYGDKITTKNINTLAYMFYNSDKLKYIPFEINRMSTTSSSSVGIGHMFNGCTSLMEIPRINNVIVDSLERTFADCKSIRYFPEDISEWFDWTRMDSLTSAYSGNRSGVCLGCYSLRSVPIDFLRHGNPYANNSYTYFSYGFQNCYSLDELLNLPIPYTKTKWTSNAFAYTFSSCSRLKNATFELQEDGSPIIVPWTKQTIDFSSFTGWASTVHVGSMTNLNSGLTLDTRVLTSDDYNRLKNNPDWWTTSVEYSRYNHDSAVATINSLPDTSAAGGTNTIKFKKTAGSLTDGGAIETLTAEEIAVATAKGWTVSFVN